MNDAVTVTFVPQQIVTWLIIGLLAGFMASLLVRGRGMNVTGSIFVGLVGALFGGLLFGVLRWPVSPALEEGITLRYIDIIVSFVGAVLVLFIVTGIRRR